MTTPTYEEVIEDEAEENPDDSDLLKKLRKQLKESKAHAKSLEEENQGFREAQSQARAKAIEDAVSGINYPKPLVDSLVTQVQDMSDEEFSSVLAEIRVVADDGSASGDEGEGEAEPAPSPASLGQQVAAAASGATKVDGIDRLNAAKSVDEVNAIAKELGLDQI